MPWNIGQVNLCFGTSGRLTCALEHWTGLLKFCFGTVTGHVNLCFEILLGRLTCALEHWAGQLVLNLEQPVG